MIQIRTNKNWWRSS